MEFRGTIMVMLIVFIASSILIRQVGGCNVCTIRNGTDVRPGPKPALNDEGEQLYATVPLLLSSGAAVTTVVAISTVYLLKSKRKKWRPFN